MPGGSSLPFPGEEVSEVSMPDRDEGPAGGRHQTSSSDDGPAAVPVPVVAQAQGPAVAVPGELPPPEAVLRELADGLYGSLLGAVLEAVEEQAAADAKHAPRVRLENSSFLMVVLGGLRSAALGGSTSDPAPAVLQRYLETATVLKQSSMALYVDQQAEYAGLARAMDLSKSLVRAAGSAQGRGQAAALPPAAEARQILSGATTGLEKRLAATRERVQKHLSHSSPYLVNEAWDSLRNSCLEAWDGLEARLPATYSGAVLLAPSPPDLARLFKAAGV